MRLAPPHAAATADNAAIAVGAVLALLLSSVESCKPDLLACALPDLTLLLGDLTPWLRYARP